MENVRLLFKRRKVMWAGWELSVGFYPGILFGIRSYVEEQFVEHVLYLPFVDISLMLYKNG